MPQATRPIPSVLLSLYACEAGLLGAVLGTYKLGTLRWWRMEGATAVGTAGAIVLLLAGAAVLGVSLRNARRAGRRVRLTLLLNVLTVAAMILAGEGALRVLAVESPRGVRLLGRELLPYSWESLSAHQLALLRRASTNGTWTGSYIVHDGELGWTVGASRSSPARHCHSSVEGIRSPAPGIAYSETARGRRVIALVGDSYTFGLDVSYENSWAGQLQQRLGDRFLVLNFGVDGYGVDQSYLRYLRDVVAWKAELVVFGVIQHDFTRTLAVYPFLAFPTWNFPFSKPRFELLDGVPTPRNLPLDSPDAIFGRPSIDDLPHLDLEGAYVAADWQATLIGHSYLARLLRTRFRPPVAAPRNASQDEHVLLNLEILRAFRKRADGEGSKSLLVYFPTDGAGDFQETARGRARERLALRALADSGLEFLDLSPDLRKLPVAQRFLPHGHYTPEGNAAAAVRIEGSIRALLRD